jgi:NADH-quinone oxidoreductase subunit M
MNLTETVSGLNPADYYPIIAILASLGIVITAAYVVRAIGRVFMGNYDSQKWHDMRPLLTLDKIALVGFVAILVVIGLFPSVIAPIVESGVSPVVDRLQEAQEAQTASVIENVYTAASSFVQRLGGA